MLRVTKRKTDIGWEDEAYAASSLSTLAVTGGS